MELKMNSQMALIGVHTKNAVFDLEVTKPQIELDIEPSRLDIKSQKSLVQIDQTQCFADAGFRNIEDFMQYWVNYSKSQLTQGIATTVAEGNNLAAIYTGYTIADMAANSTFDYKEFGIVAIPGQPPLIDILVEPGDYDYTLADVKPELRAGEVENDSQWGKVQFYVAQPNRLDIQWIKDQQVDIKV